MSTPQTSQLTKYPAFQEPDPAIGFTPCFDALGNVSLRTVICQILFLLPDPAVGACAQTNSRLPLLPAPRKYIFLEPRTISSILLFARLLRPAETPDNFSGQS